MLPIEVVPGPVDFLKAADLVQAVPLALYLETGHELHRAPVIARAALLDCFDAQAQLALLRIETHPGGARVGVPGGQQIGLVAFDKGTVTGTHQ